MERPGRGLRDRKRPPARDRMLPAVACARSDQRQCTVGSGCPRRDSTLRDSRVFQNFMSMHRRPRATLILVLSVTLGLATNGACSRRTVSQISTERKADKATAAEPGRYKGQPMLI